jgi:hypothetical protein
MELLEQILRTEHIGWEKTDADSYTIEDIGGDIYRTEDGIHFVHGNREVVVKEDDPDMKSWIYAYINGFDEFEAFEREKKGA